MNFNERGDIPSCSALGRIKNCGGSWALSKGVPDEPSEDAEKGQNVHDILKRIVRGEFKEPKTEDELLAWKLWGHMQRVAFDLFGEIELVWKAEERLWMSNDDLEPILSGQYDALCYPARNVVGDFVIIFDAKTGWQAGDVPHAVYNEQLTGLGELVRDVYPDKMPLGSIVREWAADEPAHMYGEWVRELAQDVHNGEYDVWHKAGLKTGSWCQFCPAKGNCPAYRDAFTQIIIQAGEEPFNDTINSQLQAMGPSNLVRILRAAPMAADVIKAAKEEAHRRRIAGVELPGVVWEKGNSKREIKDETRFGMAMVADGISLEAFQETKIPLGASNKAWLKAKGLKDNKEGKAAFNKRFGEFLEFSENAPSITFDD